MRTIQDMLEQEIYVCLSTLVYELSRSEDFSEELWPVLVRNDYENAVRDFIGTADTQQLCAVLELMEDVAPAAYDMDAEPLRPQVLASAETFGGWQRLCEELGLYPYEDEAYEHYAVSDWLAEKLKEKGEMVTEFMNLTIWGRMTTGQLISMDRVIQQIHQENCA